MLHELFDHRRYLIPFRAALLPQIFTDVLVIGSGVAGLRAAVAAAENGAEVIVAAKGQVLDSNTAWAQGGIAAVLPNCGPSEDSTDAHVRDTMTAGAGLCDEPMVRQIIEGAPVRIEEIVRWGMRLDADAQTPGKIAAGREGGHSFARIVHSDGDATGRELAVTLQRKVRATEHVRLFENCFVLDLATLNGGSAHGGRCIGAITHHPKYGLQVIWAGATILASGGCGMVYRETTNPPVATGDGLAMAYRAGANLADLAFMQFHPTTLYIAGAARSLITEAVRGEGAHLIDRAGVRFMPEVHPLAELAPRDVVARAILARMAQTSFSHVYLDCRHFASGRFAARFPSIHALLRKFNIDPEKQPIPIHPSAHYMVGGVVVDAQARTTLPGLFAAGEVTCTGLNGANRLASNSLLEGLVMGEVAGREAARSVESTKGQVPAKIVSDIRLSERSGLDLEDVRSSLRSVMWRHVGIEREGPRLAEVLDMFNFWARYTMDKIFDDRSGWEVQNLLLVGALMTRSALWRTESRGTHFRLDHPQPLDAFRGHDAWQVGVAQPVVLPVLDERNEKAGPDRSSL